MKIQRAFEPGLCPGSEQAAFLNRTPGYCCFLCNKMLFERTETYRTL
ncbi:MAG: helix-turn-helix domain-containing protein [Treponema sp.]|nr:helix-turn-helix domain-containing protein [Treponema sp.]